MYYSVNMWFDKYPSKQENRVDNVAVLQVFKKIASILQIDFDYIGYEFYDIDIKKEINCRISYEDQFKNMKIPEYIIAKEGDIVPVSVYAEKKSNSFKLPVFHVEFSYLRYENANYPLELTIDLSTEVMSEMLNMKTYVEIIKVLIENGYSVNNGYAHRYILQGDKFALIGAGYGITTIGQRIMINKSHKHRLREYKNKMMDIYLLNVTNLENIMQSAESVINQLREVVGDANVQIINSNLVFALPIVKTKIFDYRMFSWKKIIKIKKILNKENIV